MKILLRIFFCLCLSFSADAQIKCVWLSHKSDTPDRVVVSWVSENDGDSAVFFGGDASCQEESRVCEKTFLHHVEIPMPKAGKACYYRVGTGDFKSDIFRMKGYPPSDGELRAVIVGDIGGDKIDWSAVAADSPHIIFTCGDNVERLHDGKIAGDSAVENTKPYEEMILNFPKDLITSVPLMPILGNHDKEIRPRGKKYPPVSCYDINATAFRKIFELPQDEWKWVFEIPEFKARFIALDLNHTGDLGTTWQTCHDCGADSEQFKWYRDVVSRKYDGLTFTLQNQHNGVMRGLFDSLWKPFFEKSSAVITGYGYYQERAFEKIPYYNTALTPGILYPDKFSKFIKKSGGYLLITLKNGEPAKIVIKSLSGEVLDTSYADKIGK